MKRIRISDLDLEILVFISDMKFASAEVIQKKFFPDKGDRYPKKRLKDFVDSGLLNYVLEWGGRSYLYIVSDEGTKLLQRRGFDVVPFAPNGIDLKNYEHDKILMSLRVEMERLGKIFEWVSERNIRFKSLFLRIDEKIKIIPDGYCRSSRDDSDLIIEFENSRKSNDRIKSLLKNYQLYFTLGKGSSEKVLFFFVSESLLISYRRFYEGLNLSFPVQFILASDLGISSVNEERRWRI